MQEPQLPENAENAENAENEQDELIKPLMTDAEMDDFMNRTAQQIAGIAEAFE